MEVEHDNLRAALEWSTPNYPDQAMKLAQAVGGFWASRDYNSEARFWCKAMLARSEALPDMEGDRARVYGILGWNSITVGDHKAGRAAAEVGLALARKINDTRTMVRLYAITTLSSIFLGDFLTAQQAVTEGETLARQMGYKGELALILSTYSQMTYLMKRDVAQAKAYLDEAAVLSRDAGFRWTSSMSAFGMARVAGAMGDLETARVKFLESADIARKLGNKRLVYSSRSELAHVLREHGELDEPLEIYRAIIPGWKDLGHRAAVAHELECMAYIFARKGQTRRALTLLGAAEALRQAIDSVMTKIEQAEYEREVSTLHKRVAEAEFKKMWEEGGALTMEQAIAYALENIDA